MARTLSDLAKGLDDRAKLLPKLASDLAVGLAREIVRELTETTPVDTSKAISNWVVKLDDPDSSEIDAHTLGKGGSTFESSVRITNLRALTALYKKKPGQKIFIVNYAHYIRDLNEGSSGQAPEHFVELAVAQSLKVLRSTKRKNN